MRGAKPLDGSPSLTTRAQYALVTRNSTLANSLGLACGDVLAVYESGASMILRPVVPGPPLGLRARLAQEAGTLVPLDPQSR